MASQRILSMGLPMIRFPHQTVMRFASVAACVLVAACSDSGGNATADAGYNCDIEKRADVWGVGLSKTFNDISVAIVSSTPAPPRRNQNVWQIEVRNATDLLDNATLQVVPCMPDHQHGTPFTPSITPMSDSGRYEIDPVYMFMPGYWQIRIGIEGLVEVEKDCKTKIDETQAIAFGVCIEG